MKSDKLLELARMRQSSRLAGYACIGDFHGGIFECDHVSPWTKSGHSIDAKVMVIGQDWSRAETLSVNPPDIYSATLGFNPKFPTNANLDDLLSRHFGLRRDECYLTNLFPFIKSGNASSNIPMRDLVACASRYTLPEIRIVSPSLAICLGAAAYRAFTRAVGIKGSQNLAEAISSLVRFENTIVQCVAHTGKLGMNNRGRAKVDEDWANIARLQELATLAGDKVAGA